MKKLLILPLLSFSLSAMTCEIKLPHRLVIMGGNDFHDVIGLQECTEKISTDLVEILAGIEGKVSSHSLIMLLEQKGHQGTSISPSMLHIQHLKNIIREQMNLPSGIQVRNTRAQNGRGFLALAPGDQLEVNCPACLFGSQQPLDIRLNEFDGQHKSILVYADFHKMVRAYRLLGPVAAFASLNPAESLKEEFIEAIPHTDLITDVEILKFYKTNKPIKSGTLLRQSDFNAVNLVRAGLKTEVILENSGIRIKTHGISRSNGSLGETVEVFHSQKNKKYQGKVVDINKVQVDL